MPFVSAKQEMFLRLNHPSIYRKWLQKYGHAPKKNKRHTGNTKTKSARRRRSTSRRRKR